MARFASHSGIIGPHPKQSCFQLPLQLRAKCLVVSQLTIGILGIVRGHCLPLATESEMAHTWATWLHNPCRLGGPRRFRAGGRIRRGATSGQGGYITPAAWGVPTTSEPRAESEVAYKWARWLHNPCRLGAPHCFRAGGQNQRWPTSGQRGYITPAAWGVPTASVAVGNGKTYFLGK